MLRFLHKYKTGIYATIIFHLCAIIALMGLKISAVERRMPATIEIDLDDTQEELERLREEARTLQRELAQEIGQEISSAMAAEQSSQYLRNAAVNEEAQADKHASGSAFDENDALQKRIAATYQMMRASADDAVASASSSAAQPQDAKPYSGPSVLSYLVKGRKAVYLPVPVYRCEAGGRITMVIVVSEHGVVLDAQVDAKQSATDDCLLQAARDAALRSRFNTAAGQRQQGSITYQFIPQ